MEAIKEFDEGHLDSRLLEVLCCEGCIMGAGMTGDAPIFSRRSRVSRYVRQRLATMDNDRWKADMAAVEDLDLSRRYFPYDQRIPVPFKEELGMIMAAMGKFRPEDELNCGACGYDTCQEHAMAIFKGLAENKMCLPFTIEELKKTVQELAVSNGQLASTQAALMQSEKLASMGQLAAGIAHEVNNPLGIVLMYAHLLLQETQKYPQIRDDLTMIADQADRCKKIVAGLLHFARQNKVVLQPTDLRKLVEQAMKAMPMPENIDALIEHDLGEDPLAEVDRDQIVQVLTNLVSNAVAAMPEGGTLTIRTRGQEDFVELAVVDTGVGIPKENLPKIFEPFFTTKQIGLGTGLGLAVTYGIVKMHRGDIRVESNADVAAGPTGTTFTVKLPRHGRQD
jgi:signal transduction histidine kinase